MKITSKRKPVEKKWSKATKKERIHILMSIGMASKEAHEIYWPTWDGLPDTVKPYVNP